MFTDITAALFPAGRNRFESPGDPLSGPLAAAGGLDLVALGLKDEDIMV